MKIAVPGLPSNPWIAADPVEVPEQLQREVLERERRSMEQLEYETVLIQLDQRGDFRMRERGVALRDQAAQHVLRDVRREAREEADTELGVRQRGPSLELGPGKARQRGRQEKPAVGRQPGGDGVAEAESRRLTPRGEETHRETRRRKDRPCGYS